MKQEIVHFWATAKHGYDQSGWLFYLLGSGFVLSQFFGLAGPAGVVFALGCFYGIGRLHKSIKGAG